VRDLEALTSSVRDLESRSLFAEAVRAYQAGAYRASIISVWVAVSVDLTNKVRHLADIDDSAASEAIARLDAAIQENSVKKMQIFENALLDLCYKDLQLISAREQSELLRVYADRNLCAHPAFSSTDEVCRFTTSLTGESRHR